MTSQSGFGRSMSSILGMALLVALIALVPTDGVSATGGAYGWTQCNWAWREEAPDANIYFRDTGGFPPDVVRDGVINSFHGRLNDAAAEWNQELAALGLRTRLVRVASGALLFVRYQQFGTTPLGATVRTTDPPASACTVHSSTSVRIRFADIYLTPRPDWFTQDNNRRALWEDCPYNGFQPAYTCGRKHDFGSTFAHEIGHAIGRIPHPDEVDGHAGNTQASNIADCRLVNANGDPLWRATMCPSDSATPGNIASNEYRTERRTLEWWDIESLRQQHERSTVLEEQRDASFACNHRGDRLLGVRRSRHARE